MLQYRTVAAKMSVRKNFKADFPLSTYSPTHRGTKHKSRKGMNVEHRTLNEILTGQELRIAYSLADVRVIWMFIIAVGR